MIEIRQAKDELPGNELLDPCGHTSGLLCRKYANTLCAYDDPAPMGSTSAQAICTKPLARRGYDSVAFG